jgi:hypothetical protein
MEKTDRRPVSFAGLGLIGAGAVLGLALATPASAAPPDTSRSSAASGAAGPSSPAARAPEKSSENAGE